MRLLPIALLVAAPLASRCATQGASEPPPARVQPPPPPAPAATATPRPPKGERPTTKQGCDACRGLWGPQGIEQREICICRTNDSGKACRDGTECEGTCLLKEDSKFETVQPGPPPRGNYVGTCSEYDTTFGCHRLIPNGTRARGPLPAEEASKHFCVD